MNQEAERLATELEQDGIGCKCFAYSASECGCGASWAEYHIKDAAAILRSQAKEIAQLKTVLAGVKQDEQVLRTENEALRRGADRYQWLTDGHRYDWVWNNVLTEEDRGNHNSVDDAVDAAMDGETK